MRKTTDRLRVSLSTVQRVKIDDRQVAVFNSVRLEGGGMFFRARKSQRVKESTLVFCRSRVEASRQVQLTGGSMTLALSRAERFYKNEMPSSDGCLYGVVHQYGRFHQPFLPVEVKLSDNVSSTKTVKAGSGGALITRFGAEGEDDTFYKMEVWIEDPGLAIFDKIQRGMELSAISGMNFFHLYINFFHINEHDFAYQREIIDAEHKGLENWSKSDDGDDFYYLENPIERISFAQSIQLKSPAWADQWTDGDLGRNVFHSKDTAVWRRYSK